MTQYLPSLEERKIRFLEDCCGASGGDMNDGPIDSGEPPTADGDTDSLIDRTLNKLKSKRKQRRSRDGT